MTRVLIVDLSENSATARALEARGYDVTRTERPEDVSEHQFDALVLMLSQDVASGTEICRSTATLRPEAAMIAVGPLTSVHVAGVLLAAGADDFIAAPADIDDLVLSIQRTVDRRQAPSSGKQAPQRREPRGMGELIGESPAMQEVYGIMQRVAKSDSTVMITGETGTGKELAARTLHAQSGRTGAFVAINCASLPENLLESELFGHAKGAFTDAKAARPGLFILAQNGTLFLDEIAETSLALQAKLLRALQERTLRPVGSDHELPFDARAVVATNRDLDAEVLAGRFRADLYYRVQVIQLGLPALRSRGSDVLLLAQYFLDRYAARTPLASRTLTQACANRLLSYPWPGNVRELQNCMERAVALGGREIDVGDLPERIRRHRCTPRESTPMNSLLTLAELERRHIREVLNVVGGRRGEAARILGIDRKTLYRKVMQYGLDDGERRRSSGQYRIADGARTTHPPESIETDPLRAKG